MGKISKLHTLVKDKKKKEIYSIFDRPEVDKYFPDIETRNVFCKKYKKFSDNAFQFSNFEDYKLFKYHAKQARKRKDKIRESICKVFGISPKDEIFKNKFNWAVDGEGDELSKITAVTSSSLCALLCFYNISKEHPLYLDINKTRVKFTDSIFEWENPVFRKPSSIDVVLIGHIDKKGGKKVIYFVESKFSEYYTTGKCNLSKNYLGDRIGERIYTKEIFEDKLKMPIDFKKETGPEGDFSIGTKNQYAGGVKQMISHYIGVNNFLEGKHEHNFGKFLGFIGNADIYLGTIAYRIDADNATKFNNYYELYKNVREVLNNDLENNEHDEKFKCIVEMISYQGIFSGKYKEENSKVLASKKIKAFYNL